MEHQSSQAESSADLESRELLRSRAAAKALEMADLERRSDLVDQQMADAYQQLLAIATDRGEITPEDEDAVRQDTGLNEDRIRRVMGTLSQEGKIQYSGARYRRRPTREELAAELALA